MLPVAISTYFDILGKAQKIYSRQLEPVGRQWSLNRSELDVLLFLYNNPGYDRAADVVAHRGMAKSHVSASVSNLADRGFLLRQESPEDRRTARLVLTEQGTAIAREARLAQERFFQALHQGISPEETALLNRITGKIVANIENLDKTLTNI